MERDANYGMVALGTGILVVAAVLFGLWLGGVSLKPRPDLYDVAFPEAVSGLDVGSEVRFNGIRVGQVTHLTPSAQDNAAFVRIAVDGGTPVRDSSRARITPKITGGDATLEISAGDARSQLLRLRYPKGVAPVIETERGVVAQLLDDPTARLLKVTSLLRRVNETLSDETLATTSDRLSTAEAVTARAAAGTSTLRELEASIADANLAIDRYRALTANRRDLVNGEGKAAIADINAAALRAQSTMQAMARTADAAAPRLETFATESLPQLDVTVSRIDAATQAVREATERLRAAPRDMGRAPPSAPAPTPSS